MNALRELEEERLTPGLGKVSVNQLPIAALAGRDAAQLDVVEQTQVMKEFFLTGNFSEIARSRGIDYTSLLDLARQPWFGAEIANLEREATAQLKVRLTKMLGKTLDQLENRLAHGDQIWADHGLRLVPVRARDLAAISSAIFAKKQAIEQSENGFGSNEAKRLLGIAEGLRMRQLEPMVVRDADVLEAPAVGRTESEVNHGD